MPQIFDNITLRLIEGLRRVLPQVPSCSLNLK